jgi:hypothetical protein
LICCARKINRQTDRQTDIQSKIPRQNQNETQEKRERNVSLSEIDMETQQQHQAAAAAKRFASFSLRCIFANIFILLFRARIYVSISPFNIIKIYY